MIEYPFDTDYMIFDENKNRYVLTLKAIQEDCGIDLTGRIRNENTIPAFLKLVSNHIYNFIHSFNVDNELQDYIIAKTKKGREIIQEAMEEQAVYMLTVGDLAMSADLNKRKLSVAEEARELLLQAIPEIGCSICYTGTIRVNPYYKI